MKPNPLLGLQRFEQSIWIDFIRRGMIASGELQGLIEQDGVSGVTSNPSIFEKARTGSQDYEEAIHDLALEGKSAEEIYRALTVEDIQRTADLLRPTYDRTAGRDGFVSLEVSPGVAYDTWGTIEEARLLWSLVHRPNVMIKVPATREGLPAIQQLTGEAINVNITLLFGLPRYEDVANAYIAGLEILDSQGGNLQQVASVASFFLSRIDVLLDPILERKMLAGGPQADVATRLHGQVAAARAKVAYQMYKEIFGSERFGSLAEKGARTQRLLWSSTSTMNPAYSDTKYIEPLIGADTINTVPAETLAAYRDHGRPTLSIEQDISRAYHLLGDLSFLGIDLNAATQHLEQQGVETFVSALDRLMAVLRENEAEIHKVG
jgi:transaldolase